MTNIIKTIKNMSLNEIYIVLLMISSFISVYFLVFLAVIMPIYILVTKQIKKVVPKNIYLYLLLAFSVIGIISTMIFSRDSVVYGTEVKSIYLKVLSFLILILTVDIFFLTNVFTKKAFDISLKCAMFMSITSFVVAYIQSIFGIFADPNRPNRYASVFHNENYYGMVIEFIILIAFYYLFKSETKVFSLFCWLVIASNIAGLWLCQCRTAYIALAISFLIMLTTKSRKYFWILSLFLVIMVIVLIKNPSILPRFDTSFEYLSYRFGIWKAALQCFADNYFIGRGYYAYSGIISEYCEDVEYVALHSHNLYIEMFLNFGILGAFSLCGFTLISVKNAIKNSFQARNINSLALILGIFSAIAVHGIADTTVFWPQTAVLAIYTLAFPDIYKGDEIK